MEIIISTKVFNTTLRMSGGADVPSTVGCQYADVICGFTFTYFLATDKIQAAKSRGEVLVFRRGYIPAHMKRTSNDEEKAIGEKMVRTTPLGERANETATLAAIHRQTKIFHWQDVCYDIKIKGNPRRLLDRVDGWVKPGTLTALMVPFILGPFF
jgi:ATP-binding cassette, subfamily G (WHITE), member 2, PDR